MSSHTCCRGCLPGRTTLNRPTLESGLLGDGALAEILYRRGEYDQAVAALRRAAEIDRYGAWNNLTVLLKTLGRYAEADAAYQDGIRAGHADPFVHYGNFLVERGRSAEAETVLRQGLHYDARCGYVLGAVLLAQPGREDEGRQCLVLAAGSGVVAAALYLGRR